MEINVVGSHLVETREARVENQQCAVVHSEDDMLDTVECNRKQTGYICHRYKNGKKRYCNYY